jgi:hypothetical protein
MCVVRAHLRVKPRVQLCLCACACFRAGARLLTFHAQLDGPVGSSMCVSLRARDTCMRYCSRARGVGLSLPVVRANTADSVQTRAAGTVPPANERLLRLTSLRTLNPLEGRIGLGKEKYTSPQYRILVGGRVERRCSLCRISTLSYRRRPGPFCRIR